jgi:PAS domain S-box-containing protein
MTGESILIVEDEGVIALQLKELLEKKGYRISGTTAYGEDAVMMATESPPDLVCMDIGLMGKIDGIEAAAKIQENTTIPVIYLTSYSDDKRIERARETAPYSYIVKPFNERELLASIAMTLYRHTIDRQILETMHRYQAIMDNAAEGILLVSCETGMILEANPASSRLLGFTARELSGMTVSDLILAPGMQTGSWKECACTPEGWSGEVQFRCRDGSLRDVELSSRIIRREGAPDLSCIMAHDVTDLKRAEVALRLAHRKLNLLSGVTRHDILNQLNVLEGFLELSGQGLGMARQKEYVMKEKKAAETIRRMILFTKDYEEIGRQQPGWQRPEAIICQLVKTANLKDIRLDSRLGDLELYADPLLERVFYNLLDNSIRHGEHMKMIVVNTEPAGNTLMIRWEDNGPGVPEVLKEKIFERGFGRNTGLGLFLAREILGLTGISIRETGTFGSGARFEIFVPAGSFRYPAASRILKHSDVCFTSEQEFP